MSENPLYLFDPRGRVENPRPLDRWFYNRDAEDDREVVETLLEQVQGTQSGDDVVLEWSVPGDPAWDAIQITRNEPVDANRSDGDAQHFIIATLDKDVATYTDRDQWRPVEGDRYSYRVEAVRFGGDDDREIEEYDRHRMMFWELYEDFWKNTYENKYREYYGEADVPGWLKGEKKSPPLLDASAGRFPGTHRTPCHRSEADGPMRADMNYAHQNMDKSMESYGAARGCYEVWTDHFIDITDGFRGLYQNGDVRVITKAEKTEEYAYVKDAISHTYAQITGHDGDEPTFDTGSTVTSYTGTAEVPIASITETTHAGALSSTTTAATSEESLTLSGASTSETCAASLEDTTTITGSITETTTAASITESVTATGAISETVTAASVTSVQNVGNTHTTYNGNVVDWNFGTVNAMHLGGKAELFIGGGASLSIAASIDAYLGLLTEVLIAGKIELSVGNTMQVRGARTEFSLKQLAVAAGTTWLYGSAQKVGSTDIEITSAKKVMGLMVGVG